MRDERRTAVGKEALELQTFVVLSVIRSKRNYF